MANKERNIQKSVDRLVVFEDKKIRRIFHKGEWYFSIIDIVRVLTGTSNPSRYWTDLRTQLTDSEGFVQLFGKIEQLKLESVMGKNIKPIQPIRKLFFASFNRSLHLKPNLLRDGWLK